MNTCTYLDHRLDGHSRMFLGFLLSSPNPIRACAYDPCPKPDSTRSNSRPISSYFFVAYCIGNLLWGTILDYIGLRIGMLIGVGIWSVASVSHGWMSGFMGLRRLAPFWALVKASHLQVV
jgi:MFS family permease